MNSRKILVFLLLAGTFFFSAQAQFEEQECAKIDSLLKTYSSAEKYTFKFHELELDKTRGRADLEKVNYKFYYLDRNQDMEATTTYPALWRVRITQKSHETLKVTTLSWNPIWGLMHVQVDQRGRPCGLWDYYIMDDKLLRVVQKGSDVPYCNPKNGVKDKVFQGDKLAQFDSDLEKFTGMAQDLYNMYDAFFTLKY